MASVSINPDFHAQKHFVMGQLSQIRDEIEDELKAELETIMLRILVDAISLCPKDTGALASSINLESGVISSEDFAGFQIYAGDPNIINPKTKTPTSEYAQLVHEGHGNYEGVPFLDLAYQMHAED